MEWKKCRNYKNIDHCKASSKAQKVSFPLKNSEICQYLRCARRKLHDERQKGRYCVCGVVESTKKKKLFAEKWWRQFLVANGGNFLGSPELAPGQSCCSIVPSTVNAPLSPRRTLAASAMMLKRLDEASSLLCAIGLSLCLSTPSHTHTLTLSNTHTHTYENLSSAAQRNPTYTTF